MGVFGFIEDSYHELECMASGHDWRSRRNEYGQVVSRVCDNCGRRN